MLHKANKVDKRQTDFLVDVNQDTPLKYWQDYTRSKYEGFAPDWTGGSYRMGELAADSKSGSNFPRIHQWSSSPTSAHEKYTVLQGNQSIRETQLIPDTLLRKTE